MDIVGCSLFKMPPRSMDFNNIRAKKSKKAIKKDITQEPFGQ